jgi:hypothetical protein
MAAEPQKTSAPFGIRKWRDCRLAVKLATIPSKCRMRSVRFTRPPGSEFPE